MQKHQKEYFVLFGCLLILLTACQDDKIDIPDTGKKITINGLITTDSLLNVRISKSAYITDESSYEEDSLYSIENAHVVIYRDDNVNDSLYFDASWSYHDDIKYIYPHGNYLSRTIFPLAGKNYKIIVKVPGLPEASSTTIIPDLVKIDRVDTSRIIVADDTLHFQTNVHLICNIEFTDPGNETNYYLFNIYKKYNLYGHTYSRAIGFLSDDPIIEEKLIRRYNEFAPNVGIAFSDKILNGQKSIFTVDIDCNEVGPPFLNSCWDGECTDSGGYINTGNHKKVIYFRLYSITAEYFKYLQTLHLFSKNYDNPLSDPVMVYSNITGGYGIFAGAAVSSDSIVFHY